MSNFGDLTSDKFVKKLVKIAVLFPSYELDDLTRLNALISDSSDLCRLIKRNFLLRIDTDDQRHLVKLGKICIDQDFYYLGICLLEFCLSEKVLSKEIRKEIPLVKVIIELIVSYQLLNYVDIERQSNRIKIFRDNDFFSIDLDNLAPARKIQMLGLLHTLYVQKVLETSKDIDAVNVEKYNNVLAQIRQIDSFQLLDERWSRLFAMHNLLYSENASRKLFDKVLLPAEYDEAIYQNFNILLIPAFGEVVFDEKTLSVVNEGTGVISNPEIEISVNERALVNLKFDGTILAGDVAYFELSAKQVLSLGVLDPNIQNTVFTLSFQKFGGRQFKLVRFIAIKKILDWLKKTENLIPKIHNEEELFETVKMFMREINHIVQEDDGYRSLTSLDGEVRTLRSETDIQIALKHWLQPKCDLFGINLDREPLTGRGPLDFKFSIGNTIKCLMEVKLWNSSKIKHGLEIQLPSYLISDKTKYGLYVPVAVEPNQHEDRLRQLEEKVNALDSEKQFVIDVLDVRAWKLETASKAKKISDTTRYHI